jgi:transposase InsO family protein
MTSRHKFYFFDAGVYRAVRPSGPLDASEEIDGPALETLVLEELRATNANLSLGYELFCELLAEWFDDYNSHHPHKGLNMMSPRAFRFQTATR